MKDTTKKIYYIPIIAYVLWFIMINSLNSNIHFSKTYIQSIDHFDSIEPVCEEIDTPKLLLVRTDWRDSALTKLMKSEGFRSKPYKGLGGNMLIGYGCTYPRLWNKPTITKHQAKVVLNAKFQKYVKLAEKDGLRDNKAYAIADFIYNVGTTKYNKSTLRKLILNKASDDLVCKELMKWVHAKGVKYRGLVKRRTWECKMYSYKPKLI